MKNSEDKLPYNPEITKEDINALGDRTGNLHNDQGQDQELLNRNEPVDFEGKELDVPGRTTPENRNTLNLKDEENQLYSQGGPGNDHLEQSSDRR
ncbi:hypothetical protein NBT05_14175 [Aquimarina sp. ERC-38]|uniref:hypothetical protein n=1 Tax=Aquimarina sp. ERC-38 TaxID=2949996 RepID=UPI00224788E6|nr:hypothetical protein [Aquimarina sp. ERC-38]UZO80089.1 hypothetical protein NBT05_14175 [Aquimarina sp. ERC-38]